MKRYLHKNRVRCFRAMMFLFLLPTTLFAWNAWGDDSSGLSFTLGSDQNHGGFHYVLGEPIKLIMVMKNISGWPINTGRGFSQVELHKSLIVTDPGGTSYAVSEEGQVLDPGPPVFLNGHASIPAESLADDWVRSTIIDDLKDIFPVMNTMPGWYTIKAHQPFVKFSWVVSSQTMGLLGIQDDPGNWYGTINANTIQLYISPDQGARLTVRVLDVSQTPEVPLVQVPVKVFQGNILQNDLEDAWEKLTPVLVGTTSRDGFAVWNRGAACQPADVYTAMAYYRGGYQRTGIPLNETGWGPGCDGNIEEAIFFGLTSATPKDLIQDAIDTLTSLLAMADKRYRRLISKAVNHLEKSLRGDLWETDSNLTYKGYKVFNEHMKAFIQLMRIRHLNITEAIDAILKADELLAQTIIDQAVATAEAEGCDDHSWDRDCRMALRQIEMAQKEMAKAGSKLEKGKYYKAINHYSKAWKHGQKALDRLD